MKLCFDLFVYFTSLSAIILYNDMEFAMQLVLMALGNLTFFMVQNT